MLSALISTFKAGILAIALAPSLFFGHGSPSPVLGAAPQFVGGQVYSLAGSGISASDTNIPLVSFTLPTSNTPIQTSDIGPDLYVTLEPQSATKKEFIDCHVVNQLSNGTAILQNCTRGLQFVAPYTASSALAVSHAGGSQVVISDPPQLYQSIINYINNASTSGAVDANFTIKGISQLATGQQAASNTPIGGGVTTAPLALSSSISTSSRPTSGFWIPVTNITGDLSAFISSTTLSRLTLIGTTTIASTTFIGSQQALAIGKNMQVFTASGTWPVPNGVTKIHVRAVGGGGSGGSNSSQSGAAASGGGAGGYSEANIDVTASSTVQVVIGSGGVAAGGGNAGQNTLIGNIIAGGGNAGGNGSTNNGAAGVLGGTATGGTFNIQGGSSDSGHATGLASSGVSGGIGGASYFGSGGFGSACASTVANSGGIAFAPGSGGGGACGSAGNSTGMNGGVGATGTVIIEW